MIYIIKEKEKGFFCTEFSKEMGTTQVAWVYWNKRDRYGK